MSNDQGGKPVEKKKGFLAKFFDRLDKKLEEKAKGSGCCSSRKGKNHSCC